MGCTEPAAVALCVARSREALGAMPERITVLMSANILKNAMGVGIPGTGMTGLPIAVALGAVMGRSEKGLEVLQGGTPEDMERAKALIDSKAIKLQLKEGITEKLYIEAVCEAGGDSATAIISCRHTNFIHVSRNGEVLYSAEGDAEKECSETIKLNFRKIYDFAVESSLEDIEFLLEAADMNSAAADEAMRNEYGHTLGRTLCNDRWRGVVGDGILTDIMAVTSAACDARMGGATIPVMSNSGSGNQGITATLPVYVYAKSNGNGREETVRALALSSLTSIYIKQHLGCLSALCGCVIAATGASCGITYLMGGSYEQITYAVKNMIANLTGMICDGAKPSCSMKISSSTATAVLSAMLAMENRHVSSLEGIIDDDVDKSIRNLTAIGSEGMVATDEMILGIMVGKDI